MVDEMGCTYERNAVDHCDKHKKAIGDACLRARKEAEAYADHVYASRSASGSPLHDGGTTRSHLVQGAGAYAYQLACERVGLGMYGPCDDGTEMGRRDDDDYDYAGEADGGLEIDSDYRDPADGQINGGLMLRRTQQAAMRGIR